MARRTARNGFERAVQVFRWAKEEFKLPENLTLEHVTDLDDGETFGDVVLRGGRLVIRLSERACRTRHDYVYNALHEAAHVKLQSTGKGDAHGPAFWLQFGEIVDAYDHHGHLDSLAFPVD